MPARIRYNPETDDRMMSMREMVVASASEKAYDEGLVRAGELIDETYADLAAKIPADNPTGKAMLAIMKEVLDKSKAKIAGELAP